MHATETVPGTSHVAPGTEALEDRRTGVGTRAHSPGAVIRVVVSSAAVSIWGPGVRRMSEQGSGQADRGTAERSGVERGANQVAAFGTIEI
jgi:hypothetical protein